MAEPVETAVPAGETGEEPVFADPPDLDLDPTSTRVIDERLVLLDYRIDTAR